MSTLEIRGKLHQSIDGIEDKRAEAICTLFEDEIEQESLEYDQDFKAELDRRIEYFQSGGKMVSPEEMNNRLERIKIKVQGNALFF